VAGSHDLAELVFAARATVADVVREQSEAHACSGLSMSTR
jgi:hypothetical protein